MSICAVLWRESCCTDIWTAMSCLWSRSPYDMRRSLIHPSGQDLSSKNSGSVDTVALGMDSPSESIADLRCDGFLRLVDDVVLVTARVEHGLVGDAGADQVAPSRQWNLIHVGDRVEHVELDAVVGTVRHDDRALLPGHVLEVGIVRGIQEVTAAGHLHRTLAEGRELRTTRVLETVVLLPTIVDLEREGVHVEHLRRRRELDLPSARTVRYRGRPG